MSPARTWLALTSTRASAETLPVTWMAAASLAAALADEPMAMPTSAASSAGTSLTPSPQTATVWPLRRRSSTSRTPCSGAARTTTPTPARCAASARSSPRTVPVDADGARHGLGRKALVTGDHPHADPRRTHGLDRRPRVRPRRIGDAHEPEQRDAVDERRQVRVRVERLEVAARERDHPGAVASETQGLLGVAPSQLRPGGDPAQLRVEHERGAGEQLVRAAGGEAADEPAAHAVKAGGAARTRRHTGASRNAGTPRAWRRCRVRPSRPVRRRPRRPPARAAAAAGRAGAPPCRRRDGTRRARSCSAARARPARRRSAHSA